MAFLPDLGAELAARRRRLRAALGDARASVLEFALLTGVLIGFAAPAFGPEGFLGRAYAPFLPLLALVGYGVIESIRQRTLAAGADEGAVRAAFDRRTLLFMAAVAMVGAATFVWATLAPEPFELAPETPPAEALDVTIGP
jgi:hypothetical protein